MNKVFCLLFIFIIFAQQLLATSHKISRKTMVDNTNVDCETYQKEEMGKPRIVREGFASGPHQTMRVLQLQEER